MIKIVFGCILLMVYHLPLPWVLSSESGLDVAHTGAHTGKVQGGCNNQMPKSLYILNNLDNNTQICWWGTIVTMTIGTVRNSFCS